MSEPTCVVTDAISGVDVPVDGAALKGRSGLARIWDASGYSAAGLKAAYMGEAAFRQLVLLNLLLIPLAFLFDVSRVERAVLIAVVFLGLIIELLNSAIEATVASPSNCTRFPNRPRIWAAPRNCWRCA